MLHVNEDSNDKLFRKAAEDYFLKADNPDWESLLNKLNTGEASSAGERVSPQKKQPYGFLYSFFSWYLGKTRNTQSRSVSRLFRFGPWSGKTKKKIDPGMFFRQGLVINRHYIQMVNNYYSLLCG